MKQIRIEEAMKFRHPEIVVLVVTKSKEGKIDVTPIGWAMLGSSNPKTWAVGIAKRHYSHKAILDTKEFTLCIPSYKQRKDVLFCGSVSGWDVGKLPKTKLKILPSKKISVPLLEDSLACFECKLIDQMVTSDHTIFLGEIVAAYISGEDEGLINLGSRNLVKTKRGLEDNDFKEISNQKKVQ
ncbi:MAG: flavin reductase family protein [Candidatus Berkelbacteria bacterium]|nr:flavin reductase family protein [Candidatus Berkelbacteria bacterium]